MNIIDLLRSEDPVQYLREVILKPSAHMGKYGKKSKLGDIGGVEAKIDGIRALFYFDPDENRYRAISRGGKDVKNTEHILDSLKPILKEGWVMDGELFALDWSSTMAITGTKSIHPKRLDLKLHVFDALTSEEAFVIGSSDLPYIKRRKRMLRLLRKYRPKFVSPVERKKVKKPDDVYTAYKYFLKKGLEGGVVKAAAGGYVFGGKSPWLKMKTKHTEDFKIVGVQEGRGKYIGSLGALIIIVGNKEVSVGSGFGDDVRDSLWDLYQDGKLIGMWVEVSFQEKTKAGSLRHPVFDRLRAELGKIETK